jgi:tetratricopeptide (TPR) repeat protein
VAESSRLEDLRRRVQQDPSSIAFAQLAEECRRAGLFQEAVDVCRSGLLVHPAYSSARVTLGRALLELRSYEDAQHELEQVLRSAPENLAAVRGLADALRRQGAFEEALVQYRAALVLARHDPDLEQTIAELSRQVEPTPAPNQPTIEQPLEDTATATVDAAPVAVVDSAAEQQRARAVATLVALEQLLTAVHVARAQRCA